MLSAKAPARFSKASNLQAVPRTVAIAIERITIIASVFAVIPLTPMKIVQMPSANITALPIFSGILFLKIRPMVVPKSMVAAFTIVPKSVFKISNLNSKQFYFLSYGRVFLYSAGKFIIRF